MNDIIIASSWCSHKSKLVDGRLIENDQQTSKQCYQSDWFDKIWIPCIESQIEVDHYFFYISDCDIYPMIEIIEKIEFVYARDQATCIRHRFDYHAAIVQAALYAYYNNLNMVYIEQDCLVVGLEEALKYAETKEICYGY